MGIVDARVLERWARDLQVTVDDALVFVPGLPPGAPTQERAYWVDAARHQAYAQMERTATRLAAVRNANLAKLARRQASLAAVLATVPDMRGVASRCTSVPDMKGYASLRAQVAQAAAEDPALAGADVDDAFAAMEPDAIVSSGEEVVLGVMALLDTQAAAERSSLNGALWALGASSVWRAERERPRTSAARVVAAHGDALGAAWKDLQRSLRSGNRRVVQVAALELRRVAADGLTSAVGPAAGARAASRRAVVDPVSVQLGALARWDLVALAVGAKVAWDATWGETASHRAWVALAAAPGSAWRAPAVPSTTAADALGRKRDGSRVVVGGTVTAVDIQHRGRKAISVATVDTGSGSVEAVLPYIKIDSGGMAAGSRAWVHGTWHRAHPETGRPGVAVDRRARADAATFAERCRSAIEPEASPWPHGLAAEWSLEPATDGVANSLRYGTWFASGKG